MIFKSGALIECLRANSRCFAADSARAMGGTPDDFVLYGGTASALRLGHRQSEDFDFFSTKSFEPTELFSTVNYLRGARTVQKDKSTLTVVVERGGPVKVFFGGLLLRRISDPDVCWQNHLQLACLLDLAGCKSEVVQHRAEAKDYRDIAALIASGVSLERILAAGRAVYGGEFEPNRTLRALEVFADGNLPELDQKVQTLLRSAASAVKLEDIPVLAARDSLSVREAQ